MTDVPRPGVKRDPHEDLRIAESQISAILTIAADAIISLDERFRITLFNEGATAIFGYTPDEIIGHPLEQLIPERFRTGHHRHVSVFDSASVAARKMGDRQEIYARRKDGSEFPAEASIAKHKIGGKKIYMVVLRDVTERKRTEAELAIANTALEKRIADISRAKEEAELANRSKSEFLAMMSHELRTPLNAVIGFSDLMRMEAFGPVGSTRYRGYAGDIHDSARHLLSLINDILDLSKIERGSLKPDEEELDVAAAVQAVETLVKDRAERGQTDGSAEGTSAGEAA